MDSISKSLIILGVVLIVAGLLWHFSGGKIPLGRLPGDISIEGENSKIFIPSPLVCCSVVFSAC